jgi:2-polyprenyl-3-methyl-5-hydroxy-6-metoxy-1,4-benzoquinol methylase
MFKRTNPDIDPARLGQRVAIELDRPPRSRSSWESGDGGEIVTPAPPPTGVVLRWKRRLRAVPVLGPALARVNAWQRRVGMRERLRQAPVLRPAARWLKSLLVLTRTRRDLHDTRLLLDETHRMVDETRRLLDDTRERLDHVYPIMDAVKSEFRARDEELAEIQRGFGERLDRVADRADRLHGDVLFQQRRLETLATAPQDDARRDALAATASAPAQTATEAHVSDRLATVYEAFEDRFRGSRAEIKARHEVYLDTLRNAGAGTPTRPVLDIGCGRGEWLELLRENGLSARGIDINDAAVATCREHDLDARVADMFAALDPEAGGDAGKLGAVTAFHVIEHLNIETLVAFLDAAREALAPGGLLIVETPNCENLIVGAHTFHNDPTHKAPIPPAVGRFLVEQRGFTAAEVWRLHPMPESERLPGDDAVSGRLNTLLYGPQDYAVVARRP